MKTEKQKVQIQGEYGDYFGSLEINPVGAFTSEVDYLESSLEAYAIVAAEKL